MKKEKIQLVVPKNEVEANTLIRLIESNQKLMQGIEQEYADATKKYKWRIKSVQTTILKRFLELFLFYRKNQKELTDGKMKIATLLNGKIGTYLSSPEVKVSKIEKVKELISDVGKKFADKFLREKTTITLDKEAMEKYSEELFTHPEIAKLVKIIRKEKFKVEPDGGEMISEEIKKLEKLI